MGVHDALADLEHQQLGWLEILEQGLEILLRDAFGLRLGCCLEVVVRRLR